MNSGSSYLECDEEWFDLDEWVFESELERTDISEYDVGEDFIDEEPQEPDGDNIALAGWMED